MANINITVPLADEAGAIFIAEELTTANFEPEEKTLLNRLYTGLLDGGETLENDAPVNSSSRVFQWLLQTIGTAEEA